MTQPLPTIALSIMQPWAWLIANGHKDIENRDWRYPPRFRGRFLIHAGKTMDREMLDDLIMGVHPVTGQPLKDPLAAQLKAGFDLPTGGIVGVATLVDVVPRSTSPWFVGKLGFVIRDAEPLPFIPCQGALGFFKPVLP